MTPGASTINILKNTNFYQKCFKNVLSAQLFARLLLHSIQKANNINIFVQ